MYSTDPEWCNTHWIHVGREECIKCIQDNIGYLVHDLVIKMILRGWEINF